MNEESGLSGTEATNSGLPLPSKEQLASSDNIIQTPFRDSELVIGLVGAVGTDMNIITDLIKNRLLLYKYDMQEIRVSKDVIEESFEFPEFNHFNESERLNALMDAGNRARNETGNNAILALGVATVIKSQRKTDEKGEKLNRPRTAYIINSLKHPEEVKQLRKIYSHGFFLIGVYSRGTAKVISPNKSQTNVRI